MIRYLPFILNAKMAFIRLIYAANIAFLSSPLINFLLLSIKISCNAVAEMHDAFLDY